MSNVPRAKLSPPIHESCKARSHVARVLSYHKIRKSQVAKQKWLTALQGSEEKKEVMAHGLSFRRPFIRLLEGSSHHFETYYTSKSAKVK